MTPAEHTAANRDEAGPAPVGPTSPITTEPTEPTESTAVFVTRSRSMNLGGWVVMALVVGALAGLVWGLVQGVSAFGPLVIGALYGLVFVGGALSLLVVLVDWAREKAGRRS